MQLNFSCIYLHDAFLFVVFIINLTTSNLSGGVSLTSWKISLVLVVLFCCTV